VDAAERAAEAIKGYCGELKTTPDVIAAIIRHEYQPLMDELDRILDEWKEWNHPALRAIVRRIKGK
jgi:hypothetical protein